MKRAVVAATLAVCLAQPSMPAFAQTTSRRPYSCAAVIDRIYTGDPMTPDQAEMLFTRECAQQKKATSTQ